MSNKQNEVDMAGLDLVVRSLRVGAEKPGDPGREVTLPDAPPQNGGLKASEEVKKDGPPGLFAKVFKNT